MDAFCVLQPGTKMDKGEEGRKGYGINRMIETVKFSPKLLSRVFERVRSLGERSKFRYWVLGSNGTGRGWWSFVPWTVFKGETVPGLMACKWSG